MLVVLGMGCKVVLSPAVLQRAQPLDRSAAANLQGSADAASAHHAVATRARQHSQLVAAKKGGDGSEEKQQRVHGNPKGTGGGGRGTRAVATRGE